MGQDAEDAQRQWIPSEVFQPAAVAAPRIAAPALDVAKRPAPPAAGARPCRSPQTETWDAAGTKSTGSGAAARVVSRLEAQRTPKESAAAAASAAAVDVVGRK